MRHGADEAVVRFASTVAGRQIRQEIDAVFLARGGRIGALVVDVDLMPNGTALPLPAVKHATEVDPELQRLAYEMIRCFVDDFRPVIEPRTGNVRFRMVKHLAG